MTATYPRSTLAAPVTLSGKGLHGGEPVRVTLHPSDTGLTLRHGSETCLVTPENVSDTSRCTRLSGVAVVEHLLSALAGLGVTDAVIEVEGDELPAAGGCATPYVEAIRSVGLVPCGTLEVDGPFARVFLQDLPVKIAIGLGSGLWRCSFVLENYFTATQEVEFDAVNGDYAVDIAPARTVVLEEEIERVRQAGLGRGLEPADVLAIGHTAYLNPAKMPDEPVRHKLLDLIGDLYLAGVPMAHLNVVGERCGHRTNVAAAKKLADSVTLIRHR